MQFWAAQAKARQRTRAMLALFALLLCALVIAVNLVCYGVFVMIGYQFDWVVNWRTGQGLPDYFFVANTVCVLGLVLGGVWLERSRLQQNTIAQLMQWHGAKAIAVNRRYSPSASETNSNHATQIALNVVVECAIAAGIDPPSLYLFNQAELNAFAVTEFAGDTNDGTPLHAIALSSACLDLPRDELQAIVAHECAHLAEGDGWLNVKLASLVYGLTLVYGYGAWVAEQAGRRGIFLILIIGALALMGVGALGLWAGQLLQAAISRQREFNADARAVQYQRQSRPLVAVLMRLLRQEKANAASDDDALFAVNHAQSLALSHFYFAAPRAHWRALFDSHPPPKARIAAVYRR